MGDLAVTADGIHVMAYLGSSRWVEADPFARKVIELVSSTDNPWFRTPVVFVRWKWLGASESPSSLTFIVGQNPSLPHMNEAEKIQELACHFKALGAVDPEGWARSQVQEGIPQYARFVFLRQMWQNVVREGDTAWIDSEIAAAERRPRDPGASVGPVLKRMLALGVSREDIAELARVMQWQTLAGIAYQIDDSGGVSYPSDSTPQVHWALCEVTEEGEVLHSIDAIHESVLDVEPSGREMRPKGVTRAG
jgi:hypothetical protein